MPRSPNHVQHPHKTLNEVRWFFSRDRAGLTFSLDTFYHMTDYSDYHTAGESSSPALAVGSLRRGVPVSQNRYSRKRINLNTESWEQSPHPSHPESPVLHENGPRRRVNLNTESWVQSPQKTHPDSPIPPRSLDLPSPIPQLQPLSNPYPRNPTHGRSPLHVVNTTPDEQFDTTYMNVDGEALGRGYVYQTDGLGRGGQVGSPSSLGHELVRDPPKKKKSFVGKVFRGVGRLPKIMFGYGASEKSKFEVKRSGTFGTDLTSDSAGTGNTLPLYAANPSHPEMTLGRSGSNVQYVQAMEMPIPELPEEPLEETPEVVRLSDTMSSQVPRRSFLLRRVAPPSEDAYEEGPQLVYPQNGPSRFVEQPASEGSDNSDPADRTTVMVYNDRHSHYPERGSRALPQTPTAAQRPPSNGSGLSYADPEPQPIPTLKPLRPSSFIPPMGHGPSPADSAVLATQHSLQAPHRIPTPPPPVPGGFDSHPVAHSDVNLTAAPILTPPSTDPPADTTPLPPAPAAAPEEILSPISAHPLPADDYMKMAISPPLTSHATGTSGTEYSDDPSFSSDLNPVERFFKTLYYMPWVAHGRVTVDYRPGAGVGDAGLKGKKRRVKRLSTWYRSMLSRSRRASATLDVLNGANAATSPRTSFAANLAIALGSPLSGTRRRSHNRHRRPKNTRKHHHHSSTDRHHSDHRHHHHHHHAHAEKHQHGKHSSKRHTGSTIDTTNTTGHDSAKAFKINPAAAALYPYGYPAYPYAGYPTFPTADPAVPALPLGQISPLTSLSRSGTLTSPRGAPGDSQAVYPPPPGYASYQAMIAPQHMYFFQPTGQSPPHTAGGAIIPVALVPGADDKLHGTQPLSQKLANETHA